MAKQKIQNYVFLPGVSSNSNAYPNAYALLTLNKEFIQAEVVAYINQQITQDNATNLNPNAVALLTNNRQFIIDEIIAWVAYKVANNVSPFVGYTYSEASCRRDTGYLIDALIYDIRYGGNERIIEFSKNLWQGGVAQLISPTQEVAGFNQIFTLINSYILTKTPYTSQQSPVNSSQNISGTAGEAGVTTLITNLQAIVINVIPNGLSVLPAITYSIKTFAGYAYDPTLCYRDVGMVFDGYLHDMRYGGNTKTRYVASRFWNGSVPQIVGDRKAEIAGQTFVKNLITNTLLVDGEYTPIQTAVPRQQASAPAEAGSPAVVNSLATSFINVLTNGLGSLPALVNGVTTIRLQGKYKLETLLLITNTTTNQVLYNFSDSTLGATVLIDNGYVSNDYYQDDDYPSYRQIADYTTTITLAADTSNSSVGDDIQIFVEAKEQRTRPYDFGTDAIERHRVAQPQSMLDADFEYGLQPTKWQAIGLARGYPSVYEIPGTETPVANVVTDASAGTANVGESLITVTTTAPHGFTVGTPITIKALANSITGFSRAEGTFLINTVPTTTSFTYYAVSKVGTSNGQVLATTYTQLRKGSFYTGAAIGTPTFSVYTNGTLTTFTSQLTTPANSALIPFTGTAPAIGAPLTGTGLSNTGQVTGVVGSGGIAATATFQTDANISDTTIELIDTTGILQGMAVDNGSGTAIFVNDIVGFNVSLTAPITTFRRGDTATYTNVTGTNIPYTGTGASFTITRVGGQYNLPSLSGGTGYVTGNRIKILGTDLDGTSPENDLIIEVDTHTNGVIDTVTITGTSISGDSTYSGITASATDSVAGNGATFTILRTTSGYGATVTNPGAGYADNETITLAGTNLGGLSPTNDAIVTILSTDITGGILTYSITGTTLSSDKNFGVISGSIIPIAGTNGSFDITRSNGSYSAAISLSGTEYYIGDTMTVLGTSLGGATPANDAILTVTGVTGTGMTTASVTGTAVTGTQISFYSTVNMSDITTSSIPTGTVLSASAISVILVTFANNHGLVPGASVLIDISSTGTNHALAKGPFFVEQVPSLTTFRYTARAAGTIDTGTAMSGTVYCKPDAYFVHRPYDGGVMLSTGGPQHGAQAIRMSKKYIRYQSGKGINYCTGALFAPSFNIQSMSASGISIGSYITVTMDDVDHGCQVGGVVRISNVDTIGYNGVFTVSSVISERVFVVQAQTVLTSLNATITTAAIMSILSWHGATVRAGTFDDQNGIFFQYNGREFAVGRRTATLQLAGVVNISRDTNVISGTNTRFRDQVKAGDRIVIRGMTHVVTAVTSQSTMYVNPDYRGASNAVQAKICLVQDIIVPQSQFNLDKLDGTGPSGFKIDLTKMQMIGMQWSWYAVGFIDFMLRGSDGNFIFFHRIRNSNVNTEAYMRTGNQPVRYEVINESASGKLANSITSSQTTVPLVDASAFPNDSGIVYIDNELIGFSGKSGNNLIGCTRSAPLSIFAGGSTRTVRAGIAATHEYNTGAILVSTTISPVISHWGSAMLTDGNFDTDRGYLFNYASTGVSVSTTKATAFLIRLAPSVSNAITGDLGDRELINRAQLLLQTIEVTSDTGTGGIVVEGVLNPQNYPTDPANITWGGLSGLAQGGQPSFAQIAPGGSVSWSSGESQTTATATTSSTMTGSITELFGVNNNVNYLYVDATSWTNAGGVVGCGISGTGIQSGTVVTSAASYGSYVYLNISKNTNGNVNNGATLTISLGGALSGTNYLYFTQASWAALGASVGQTVTDAKFPAGTRVSNISPVLTFGGTQYYKIIFTQNSNGSIAAAATVTFTFGQPPYALPGETVFSFISTPGSFTSLDLSNLKELTNTTLGGRGTYPNGPDVLAINVYKVSGTSITANIVLRWGEAQA